MSLSAVSSTSNEPNLIPATYSPGHVKRLRAQYETNSSSLSSPEKPELMSAISEADPEGNAPQENVSKGKDTPSFCEGSRISLTSKKFLSSESPKDEVRAIDGFHTDRPMTAPAGCLGTGDKEETPLDVSKSVSSSKIGSNQDSEKQIGSSRLAKSYLPFPISKSSLEKSLLDEKQSLIHGSKDSSSGFFRSHSSLSMPSFMKRRLELATSVKDEPISPMQNEYPLLAPYLRKNSGEGQELPLFDSNEHSAQRVLRLCGQKKPIPMDVIFQGIKNMQKLGEGVFGEVYLGHLEGSETSTSRVYKVVAIEGDELVNGEKQKKFGEILPEIFVSQQVSKLHDGYNDSYTDGFVKMYNGRITSGKYPQSLIQAWSEWDEENESDNECPSFSPNQLYVIFEYEHGGQDVEPFGFTSARQTVSLVLQIAHILAVGEGAFEMEHRDLHWGNVLVNSTNEANLNYKINGQKFVLPSNGVKGCIIDFTLARILGENGQPVYLDLGDDEEQFLGTGDHQFDIYRMMKDFNRNDWGTFYAKSNVYWVHYLAEKLIRRGRYDNPDTGEHAFFLNILYCIHRKVMRFGSCVEFVKSSLCEQFKSLSVSPFPIRDTQKDGEGSEQELITDQ